MIINWCRIINPQKMYYEITKMALESLLGNKTRTLLSMLGIIIGVSTVIAVVGIGKGAEEAVNSQFEGLSANSVMIMGNMGRGATSSSKLKTSDAEVLLENGEHIALAVGSIQGNTTVAYGSESSSSTVVGGSEGYFEISNLKLNSGRFYTEEEIEEKAKVAVLGSSVIETFFDDGEEVIGVALTVAGKKFEVIGVLEEVGTSMGPFKIDDSIIIPNTTAEKSVLGNGGMVMLNTQIDSIENVELATAEIKSILREEHGLKDSQEDDFKIMDAGSMVSAAQDSAALMTVLLTVVAAITLLVSGIGIMNVMFVTVSERTKEIGIAKAIGGKQGDILSQFLLESVILSMLGGLLGIALGMIALNIITSLGIMTIANTITGPLIGFSFSVIVGVFFGFYPALKASRLDPVDALRSE